MCDIKNREAAVDTVDMWAKRRESKLLLKMQVDIGFMYKAA